MRPITEGNLLQTYIDRYDLKEIFDREIVRYMTLYALEKGECICQSGDAFQSMFFLVKGKLKVYTVQENGKALLLRFNKPLSIVGDMEFLTGYRARCNVEAVNKCFLIEIKYEYLNQFSYEDPKFLRFLIKQICHKLYTISNATALNLLYPVENRFASYLLSTMVDEQDDIHKEELKSSKLTEVATLLGTSYRHLNRVIGQLEKEGVITRGKGAIVIHDMEKIKELSCGSLYE
ncbi:CRP-like cAMP-binding protein [Anaerosolibacter carboniphilus]|uniref:CRP-like cAMP-binding protein n=1 Tax=Anaerosolibacter carboniphilus TaxID=1417629 RepID=A0A841KY94_9FIRM|nr:cyclic nucleotide-binding domain-containing protein [Anaerosolibacter carboniphilus]MBB6218313.1 CRP-like cAMP-binding protein [Anaerosolibacter carboniphilus]